MKFKDLREFIDYLEQQGELKRITQPVDPDQEITEICDRTLRAGGPALLFENPVGYDVPVLANLFGTPGRVAMGMGRTEVRELREVGKLLAYLKEPEPPKGFPRGAGQAAGVQAGAETCRSSGCVAPLAKILSGRAMRFDLDKLPVMSCWPDDVAPLLTWGLTVTKGPNKKAPEPGDLPPAENCQEQDHHALVGPPRRRA